jgi:hypothetical protein
MDKFKVHMKKKHMTESKKKSLQLQHQEMIEEEVSLVYPFFHEECTFFKFFKLVGQFFKVV